MAISWELGEDPTGRSKDREKLDCGLEGRERERKKILCERESYLSTEWS
jgi:hypothetical protein